MSHSWAWVFPSNASCQLYILWYDGNPFSIGGAQVGALKETNQVQLHSFLWSTRSSNLELETSITHSLPQFSNNSSNTSGTCF